MNKSFKASKELIDNIITSYFEYEIENDNPIIYFKAKADDFSLIIYKNGTVYFQGNEAEKEASKWIKDEKPYTKTHMGSDEVGCGDLFGPIVVAATIVNENDYEYLIKLGVKDSKQLSDEKMLEIADKIKEKVKYSTFTLSVKKYNELTTLKNYNLNKIKAYLHNFVLYELTNKENYHGDIIIDDFCGEKNFYYYLNDYQKGKINNITFETKAENKYLAVACASIIARVTFLKEIEKIEKILNTKILLGASNEVDELAYNLIKEKGYDYLKDYLKIHFKNTKKILERISEI